MNPKHHNHSDELFPELNTALDAALLSDNEVIQPSAGFAASVMQAIHDHAAATSSSPISFPPIPFPWSRALPGLIAVFCAAAVVITAAPAADTTPAAHLAQTLAHASLAALYNPANAWISLAAALSLASLIFTWSLAHPRR